jgi:hypothetical protein
MSTRFLLKLACAWFVAFFVISLRLYAATVDGMFDDNQNDFEYYWYYYDDNSRVGRNDRPQAGPTTNASIIDVVSKDSVRHAFGNIADTSKVKVYTFTTGREGDNKYAALPFTMGSTWTTSSNNIAYPYIGIGTMLCAEGDSINLTSAKSVTFKIRSHKNPVTVSFKVLTKAIENYSIVQNPPDDAFGYYSKTVPVTTSWTTQTVALSELVQPLSWCKGFAWNHSSGVTKLAWEISQQLNKTVLPEGAKDTLEIDDITVDGYKFPYTCPPYAWCVQKSVLPTIGLFSNFEYDPKNQATNMLYWYAFNDAEIGGTSRVDYGAEPIEGSKQLWLIIDSGNGSGGSYAPALKFTFGPAINQNGNLINGFAGIGINTYDSINCNYWNAQVSRVTSIFFQYTYQGDAEYLTLEVRDSNDVGDSKNPTRNYKRGQNIVWFTNLLPTPEGVWASVEIPLSQLSIHSELAGANPIPLDLNALTNFRWIVQGEEGQQGKFAIDNIFFPGCTSFSWGCVCPSNIKNTGLHGINSSLHAFFRNGVINVNWNNQIELSSGRISLINARGSIISSFQVTKTARFTRSFSSKNIPSGIYFVKLNAVDTNGKTIMMQAPVSVTR